MSESKRSRRKSKLEVRDFVDIEESENMILQSSDEEELMTIEQFLDPEYSHHEVPIQPNDSPKPPESPTLPPTFYDHTYACTNEYSTPSSAFQLSVKVEVEEFDESIINTNSPKPELSVALSTLDIPNLPQTVEVNRKPRVRQRSSISIFEVNLEKMYEIADHINLSSTNLADKHLSVEIKNTWGRALKPEDDNDPYNIAIQKALQGWGNSLGLRATKESPLFYQCLICKLAWWYLTPFKDHIRTHDHSKIMVYHQENNHESHIVASESVTEEPMYIPCEGNCYRCGNPYNFHITLPIQLYKCKKCHKKLETCALIPQHELECIANKTLSYYNSKKTHECYLCHTLFKTESELDLHMITSHKVRSDIPSLVYFKTCSVCLKLYYHFSTHMCVKSPLSWHCMYCYRKFHTKTLLTVHYETGEENYHCKICDLLFTMRCMETEHMLTHTDKFQVAYKCIHFGCSPTMLFPDESSVRRHKVLYHNRKFDRRRTYYEKVLIPVQCAKSISTQLIDDLGDRRAIRIEKVMNNEEEVVSDWCVPKLTDKQTEENQYKPAEEDDDMIIIKQEVPEMEPIEIDSQDESQGGIHEDSQDEGQYGQMDYAEMLSKVFKMSDTVRRPRLASAENIQTQIKIEPSDTDFENLIDIENAIVKQEPIGDWFRRSFEDTYQSYSCQNNSLNDSCQNYSSRVSSSLNDRYQQSSSQTDTGQIKVKTEPLDYEVDCDMTAVTIEAADIKQEIQECAEVNEYTGSNVITAEALLKIPEKINTKTVKKNPNSLLKTTHEIDKIGPFKNYKSLLKKNFAEDKNADAENADNKNESISKHNPKSVLKRQFTGDKSKVKSTKFDENGTKIKKLYKCSRCGYTQKHRLFRLHQKSLCKLSPSEDGVPSKQVTRFLCTKCDVSYGSLKAYLIHFSNHGYGVLQCPCCNVKFEIFKDLMSHFHKHVRQNYVNCWMINDEVEMTKKQHRCQTCRQIVAPEKFFLHWEAHLKLKMERVEPKQLEIVRETEPSNKKQLPPSTLHIALQQLRSMTQERNCFVCSRKFSRRYDVKRHLIEHLLMDAYSKKDKIPTLMLRCQICLEEMFRAEQYKFHMREHGGLPVYRCDLCDKTFSDSSNFAKHKKIHNMRVVICDICQKKFQAKSSLEKHIIMHMTTDPIKCNLCDRTFHSKSLYNKHMHVRHTRASKFRCVVCDMTFESLRNKWDHAWAVHKERKHKADCPICHQGFRKYQDVKNHAKQEHQLELSFYNMKSESGVVNNFNMFSQVKKKKKKTTIVSKDYSSDTD